MSDNLSEWTDEKLARRLDELSRSRTPIHSDERWRDLQREINHIKFEQMCRRTGRGHEAI